MNGDKPDKLSERSEFLSGAIHLFGGGNPAKQGKTTGELTPFGSRPFGRAKGRVGSGGAAPEGFSK